MKERTQPKKTRYYKPLESPTRYPLELTGDLHICLWSECGEFKWTIAYWVKDKEDYSLCFVGDRPLNQRVDWAAFRDIVVIGQAEADRRFGGDDDAY